jgi:putative phosphoesterase
VKVGLISDTHGLLRPEALEALRGCAHIIHAGDIGDASILERLRGIAPVTAVRGNNDRAPWAADIPDTAEVALDGARVYVIHDLNELDRARAKGCGAVIAGHSHKPASRLEGGVLYVNPGSAGPRRFSLPISVGFLHVAGSSIEARLLTLA